MVTIPKKTKPPQPQAEASKQAPLVTQNGQDLQASKLEPNQGQQAKESTSSVANGQLTGIQKTNKSAAK